MRQRLYLKTAGKRTTSQPTTKTKQGLSHGPVSAGRRLQLAAPAIGTATDGGPASHGPHIWRGVSPRRVAELINHGAAAEGGLLLSGERYLAALPPTATLTAGSRRGGVVLGPKSTCYARDCTGSAFSVSAVPIGPPKAPAQPIKTLALMNSGDF